MSDDLRARLVRAIRDAVRVAPLGPNSREIHERGGSVCLTLTEAEQAADAALALLADPAPEAAREDERRAARGNVLNALMFSEFAGQAGEIRAVVMPVVYAILDGERGSLPLPVATGVTTEDEGCSAASPFEDWVPGAWEDHLHRCASVADHGTDDHRCACGAAWGDPAPAPVVSAGDEGVGLSEEELRRIVRHMSPMAPGHALVALQHDVERILAARVAEAGARALREAADGFDPAILEGVVDMSTSAFRQGAAAAWSGAERFLRDRADQIGGA